MSLSPTPPLQRTESGYTNQTLTKFACSSSYSFQGSCKACQMLRENLQAKRKLHKRCKTRPTPQKEKSSPLSRICLREVVSFFRVYSNKVICTLTGLRREEFYFSRRSIMAQMSQQNHVLSKEKLESFYFSKIKPPSDLELQFIIQAHRSSES